MSNQFDATGSLLGYLYQVRVALLDALVRLRKEPRFLIRIETLDDVSFEVDGKPQEILQTKHHVDREASVGDSSVDLWKTIRVWIEGRNKGEIDSNAVLALITTSVATSGSAASYLRRDEHRDIVAARTRLAAAASTSTNKVTTKARSAFLALDLAAREDLLRSVVIADGAPSIAQLDAEFRRELIHATEPEKLSALASRLEGWWSRRVLRQLVEDGHEPILSEEIQAEVSDLREQFRRDNLPIDEDLLEDFDEEDLANRPFVEQLKLIDVRHRRIFFAMQDYYRAAEQRSRWVREDLLLVGDLHRYESLIKEEWERRFEGMLDEIGSAAVEEEKRKLARQLYGWVETDANVPIRPDCTAPFVTRGSLHMLSNKGQVGWHPEFRARLKHLFEELL